MHGWHAAVAHIGIDIGTPAILKSGAGVRLSRSDLGAFERERKPRAAHCCVLPLLTRGH